MDILEHAIRWRDVAMIVIGLWGGFVALIVADMLVEAWSQWRREKHRAKRRRVPAERPRP